MAETSVLIRSENLWIVEGGDSLHKVLKSRGPNFARPATKSWFRDIRRPMYLNDF